MFPPETKVLVADDMITMRKMIRNILNELELTHVTEAKDGQDALEQLENAAKMNLPFDLLISDWNMPRLKGIDLVGKVRATPGIDRIPIMMVTAENKIEQVKAAIAAGATHYVVKPFSPAIFKEKLEIIWEIHLRRTQAAQQKA